jgi:hypothetical protein
MSWLTVKLILPTVLSVTDSVIIIFVLVHDELQNPSFLESELSLFIKFQSGQR